MFEPVLTGAQMAAADRYTSESLHIPALVLMERAALAVAYGVSKSTISRYLKRAEALSAAESIDADDLPF